MEGFERDAKGGIVAGGALAVRWLRLGRTA
ncbi:hypothetical protein F753_12785 [Stutzerimonas chloritidismutans AW-1]|uniref:Uncharacterized protein n=1 Tax=Stutzerimonas chloritidismutans AW-1 TaxID=1263865 RepID=V4S125_STUCH|nr:hypothetical protein F753_12785 [Stutzerimonas chloritidismutans AW-1]